MSLEACLLLLDLSAFPRFKQITLQKWLMPSKTDLIMFSPLHTLVSPTCLVQPPVHCNPNSCVLTVTPCGLDPPLHEVFSLCITNLFIYFYSLCSLWTICNAVSTHRASVSCSLISHHCRLYRLLPSWRQPACFLITLMSETWKDIIS